MVRGLMDYLARCSYMLRQGWFVGDVCYYYGDQAPNFYPPLCDVPEKPLLEGLGPCNDYDVCSSEVILRRMRVERGRIVLPDGMSYAVLVLPEQDHIPSEVLARIRALVADGATVIGHQRPIRAPGNKDQQAETARVLQLAEELWGRSEASDQGNMPPVVIRSIDKGRFIIARDRTAALREIGVAADLTIVGNSEAELGPLDFIHRRTAEDEFYFIRNKTRDSQALPCRFRVAAEAKGLVPESLAKLDRLFLELGDLAEIAEITLNGKRLGPVWLPPYRIEISDAVHVGVNQLEIRVANLWANRLNGDSLRPESTRFTRSNLDRIQTDPTSDGSYGRVPRGPSRPVYTEIPPLMKSGLIGPVRIIAALPTFSKRPRSIQHLPSTSKKVK